MNGEDGIRKGKEIYKNNPLFFFWLFKVPSQLKR